MTSYLKHYGMINKSVLGICGGNGVILHPFKRHLIGNIEPRAYFRSKGNEQWGLNFKNVPFSKGMLPEAIREKENVRVIIGAPDCGHSSIFTYSTKKTLKNPRNNPSYNTYLEGIQIFKPDIWLMENLPKILNTHTKKMFKEEFPEYRLIFNCIPMTYLGNSQGNRVRLILIGVKRSWLKTLEPSKKEKLLESLHILPSLDMKLKTVEELTGDLLYAETDHIFGHIREPLDEEIYLYAKYKCSLESIQNGWLRHKKDKRWMIKKQGTPMVGKFNCAPGTYRNMLDKTPLTIRKGDRQFNPIGLMMTPREMARIQGIPDDFKIYINRKPNLKYWLTKARATVGKTPCYEVGSWFFKVLKQYQVL